MTKNELRLRLKHRTDFTYYAPRALIIRTKDKALRRFALNDAQMYLHSRLEDQKRRTGKIRVLILKGRQQGCSTYTEGRFYWKVTHERGVKAFILTQADDATTNLFGMTERFHKHCPAPMRPKTGASNAKELNFKDLESGFKVGTAGSKAVARSDTIQYFHGSEVAYWPNAEEHVAGALQAVPDAPGTEVILESTSAGAEGLFYDYCMMALEDEKREAEGKAREQDYELIFIPWYWQQEYRSTVPAAFELNDEEKAYKEEYQLSDAQMVWRRKKIKQLRGVHRFRHEYPATVKEAFTAEVPGALWTREMIDENRWDATKDMPRLVRIVVAVDPSGGEKPENDEQGIGAAGLDAIGHVHVLDDVSGHYSPRGWGSKAVALYHKRKADRVVGERNFGGDMVKNTIKTVDPKVSYKDVTASRGKDVRAEPIAAFYEDGIVHHHGYFINLEDELVTWVPGQSKWSPNRLDWLVWAITELKLAHGKAPGVKAVAGDMHSPYDE